MAHHSGTLITMLATRILVAAVALTLLAPAATAETPLAKPAAFAKANVWVHYACDHGKPVRVGVIKTRRTTVSLTHNRKAWELTAHVNDGTRIRANLWAPGHSHTYSATRGPWLTNGNVWTIPATALRCG